MTTEYIVDTAQRNGTLSRYDSGYYQVKRIAMIIKGMSRRATLEKRANALERRNYRDALSAGAGK